MDVTICKLIHTGTTAKAPYSPAASVSRLSGASKKSWRRNNPATD